MNKPFASLCLIVLALALVSVVLGASPAASLTPPNATKLDAIFSRWSEPNVPGCVVAVKQRNQPAISRSYGSADLEHAVPIGDDTLFEAGSVSKQFTAASALILVEQGKLKLDDDVRKYLPELPDYGVAITIAELLGHTSGLRDWEGVVDITGWPVTTRFYTVKDVLEIATRQKHLNYRPGAAFSYTNTGYVLLAVIVERVSGESFAQFGRRHLFEPLGMRNTQWRDDFRAVVKARAVAYDAVGEVYHQLMPFESVIGAGGLLTTAGDLLKWNDALDAGKLGAFVTSALQRAGTLSDGRPTTYASGLYVDEFQGMHRVWHSGETAGYEAYLARFPDQHLSIALLCNAGQTVDVDSTGDKVAALFLAASDSSRVPAAPVAGPNPSPDQLAPYAGIYFNAALTLKTELIVKDGTLQRVADGLLLVPQSPGVFRASASTIRFSGRESFVRQFDDGRVLDFQRIQPWHPQEAELQAFTGQYRSDEAAASCDVALAEGQIVVSMDDRRWDTSTLQPVSRDTFMKPHHTYRFVRDSKGAVTDLEISDGWEHVYALSFHRVDAR